ncbi:MAG TPA: DsbA family oxidoreductase [Acidimicrobiales bacterium]|nr:DsbA family oxidoreductase [Acidimicrobiales bacterium]
MLVEIWSDVVCPWCYIGKRRFEAAMERFEHKDEVEVRWRSFELDPRAPFRRSGTMADHIATKYGMSREEAAGRLDSMNRLAAREGLDYDLARTQGGNSLDAHRLIHLGYAAGDATGGEVNEALLKAYFVDLLPISEPDVLLETGSRVGLEPGEIRAILEGDRFVAEVRADELEAARLGCTGVPFFVIDRAFAIPGAQDVETFALTLERAWGRSHPAEPETVVADGAVCTDGDCPI